MVYEVDRTGKTVDSVVAVKMVVALAGQQVEKKIITKPLKVNDYLMNFLDRLFGLDPGISEVGHNCAGDRDIQ
jgi:hypothetical protein